MNPEESEMRSQWIKKVTSRKPSQIERMNELKKQGVDIEELHKQGIDIKIQRLDLFIPEINKTIIMVKRFRPDLSISPDGEILYSVTSLTKEEANIIKRCYPRLFAAFIEEEEAGYVV